MHRKSVNFRAAFLTAIATAETSGELSKQEARRLRFATLFPRMLASIEEKCCEMADLSASTDSDLEGYTAESINWDSLKAWLQKLLPIILQLMAWFG